MLMNYYIVLPELEDLDTSERHPKRDNDIRAPKSFANFNHLLFLKIYSWNIYYLQNTGTRLYPHGGTH